MAHPIRPRQFVISHHKLRSTIWISFPPNQAFHPSLPAPIGRYSMSHCLNGESALDSRPHALVDESPPIMNRNCNTIFRTLVGQVVPKTCPSRWFFLNARSSFTIQHSAATSVVLGMICPCISQSIQWLHLLRTTFFVS